MFQLISFVVVSIVIVITSWASLRNPHSHGFFRFFAFECILALFLLNVEHWFSNPLSIFQIVSWLLLLGSALLAAHGFYLLHNVGEPKRGIEDTTSLVVLGAYKYIRHPLYASLILLGWGIFFKGVSLFSGILIILSSAFLIATAKVEEIENLRKFSAAYAEYTKTTKMFIPFLF